MNALFFNTPSYFSWHVVARCTYALAPPSTAASVFLSGKHNKNKSRTHSLTQKNIHTHKKNTHTPRSFCPARGWRMRDPPLLFPRHNQLMESGILSVLPALQKPSNFCRCDDSHVVRMRREERESPLDSNKVEETSAHLHIFGYGDTETQPKNRRFPRGRG